jgi:hypothetical protein
MWNIGTLKEVVCNWEILSDVRETDFLELMNLRFPPDVFRDQLDKRRRAIENTAISKKLLDGAVQNFPKVLSHRSINSSFNDMNGFAIVFTAGGEGERLRLSLMERGVAEESLRDFTKATYPLKNFFGDFGALQINLAMIGRICRDYKIDVPVIVTTGPESSITYRVIPAILERYKNFGLPHVKVVPQDERLHFTVDGKIAVQLADGNPYPVTQPDETGGPLMKLKQETGTGGSSALQWLAGLGCEKLLIAQGTAIYEPRMLACMASAARGHDCVGVGIPRNCFDKKDPFGTFVEIEKNDRRAVCIIEQDIRNDETITITDKDTGAFLPFNTGLYAVDRKLLEANCLPDYATPPKEILPGLPRSPKIGYAATDILPLAKDPLILTVSQDMYAVIKTADDLETMSETAIKFGLREMAGEAAAYI